MTAITVATPYLAPTESIDLTKNSTPVTPVAEKLAMVWFAVIAVVVTLP